MSKQKNDGGDKTEKPTAKRIKDARKEGDIHKSRELTSTVLVLAWLVMFWLLMPFVVEPVLGALPQVGARVGPWLPFGNAYTFTKTPWFQTFSLWWGTVGAVLYFAAVAAAVFLLALVVVTRRDP